ncbi:MULTISPECIES: hypothetical protein [unclassified Polaromonas]|uniref:hypothetical protein n=1 Tax=unclassified Polaromonas TaxID=2638319 RepID=UPI0025F51BD1|nr:MULTISPECIES: hypothetical protein [unclassified Polaromonas]HQS00201.1 hypothetical protein [Polaromonas sp.]HQT08870.1 hypothetical protein [Polaromonas sp.]
MKTPIRKPLLGQQAPFHENAGQAMLQAAAVIRLLHRIAMLIKKPEDTMEHTRIVLGAGKQLAVWAKRAHFAVKHTVHQTGAVGQPAGVIELLALDKAARHLASGRVRGYRSSGRGFLGRHLS